MTEEAKNFTPGDDAQKPEELLYTPAKPDKYENPQAQASKRAQEGQSAVEKKLADLHTIEKAKECRVTGKLRDQLVGSLASAQASIEYLDSLRKRFPLDEQMNKSLENAQQTLANINEHTGGTPKERVNVIIDLLNDLTKGLSDESKSREELADKKSLWKAIRDELNQKEAPAPQPLVADSKDRKRSSLAKPSGAASLETTTPPAKTATETPAAKEKPKETPDQRAARITRKYLEGTSSKEGVLKMLALNEKDFDNDAKLTAAVRKLQQEIREANPSLKSDKNLNDGILGAFTWFNLTKAQHAKFEGKETSTQMAAAPKEAPAPQAKAAPEKQPAKESETVGFDSFKKFLEGKNPEEKLAALKSLLTDKDSKSVVFGAADAVFTFKNGKIFFQRKIINPLKLPLQTLSS